MRRLKDTRERVQSAQMPLKRLTLGGASGSGEGGVCAGVVGAREGAQVNAAAPPLRSKARTRQRAQKDPAPEGSEVAALWAPVVGERKVEPRRQPPRGLGHVQAGRGDEPGRGAGGVLGRRRCWDVPA